MATPHGDSVWLFGLNGKMGPAAAPGTGTGTEHAGEGDRRQRAGGQRDKAGKAVFVGQLRRLPRRLAAHGGNGGPDLTSDPEREAASRPSTKQVTNGGGGMPRVQGHPDRRSRSTTSRPT